MIRLTEGYKSNCNDRSTLAARGVLCQNVDKYESSTYSRITRMNYYYYFTYSPFNNCFIFQSNNFLSLLILLLLILSYLVCLFCLVFVFIPRSHMFYQFSLFHFIRLFIRQFKSVFKYCKY